MPHIPLAIKNLIIHHFERKLSQRQIAKMVNVSQGSVGRVVRHYLATKTVLKSKMERTGRKENLSFRMKRRLRMVSASNPSYTARQVQQAVGGSCLAMSLRSIQRYLKKVGRFCYKPTKSPTWTKKQCRVRKQWCKQYKHWTSTEWSKVIFSDECYIDFYPRGRPSYVRRGKGEKITQKHCVPHRPFLRRLLVWGCITSTGVGPLEVLEGTMTAKKYINVLEKHVTPFKDLFSFFQEDNAPCHKCRLVETYKDDNDVECLPWPPYSPDINVIENVWSVLKRKVNERRFFNFSELKHAVKALWDQDEEIKQTCISAFSSLPKRLDACLKSKGGFINY